MNKKLDLKKLKKIIKKKNINQYLRKNSKLTEAQIIKLSYDLQAGSYIKMYDYKKSFKNLRNLIKEVNSTNFKTLLDFGGGELTNFYTLIKNIKRRNSKTFFSCDISFLRLFHGVEFLKRKNISLNKVNFFVNDNYKIPLPDSSIDIVTTCHVIEPNKKMAINIIKELFRITKKKLILLEPDNKLSKKRDYLSQKKIDKRFQKHNYVKNIDLKLKKLKIKFDKIYLTNHFNNLNPASIFLIKKNLKIKKMPKFINPNNLTNKKDFLKQKDDVYFSKVKKDRFNIINRIALFNKNGNLIG